MEQAPQRFRMVDFVDPLAQQDRSEWRLEFPNQCLNAAKIAN